MFGNLVEELDYWHKCCDSEFNDDGMELQYCEQRFIDILDSCKEFRGIILEDLNEYILDCKLNQEPIDLSYYRIKKQLEESSFEYNP